ncbi:MAG: NADH-quinone oxidoreductase subunit C [Gammaproteobacteria bacterium]|nr:NADH-quinone oxidoreductase subunit C [Gammaproteobacteria bacterium]
MSNLLDQLQQALGDQLRPMTTVKNGVGVDVSADHLIELGQQLRDLPEFKFEMLIDLAGVDFLGFGQDEWTTESATVSGFSRASEQSELALKVPNGQFRFAVVYQLLSITHNHRLQLRCFCPDDTVPRLPSVTDVWASANWFEREAFDLFGIVFDGHDDLRRLLTDYGFIGHPFRKDFPLSGHTEVRYDPTQGRVVYEPVSIEPRTLVPKVIRDDHRYDPRLTAALPDDLAEKKGDA